MKLWIVENEDWDYDDLSSAAVWAETDREAVEIVRRANASDIRQGARLTATEAPTTGVAHVHIHYG